MNKNAALIRQIRKAFDKDDGPLAPGLRHKIMGYSLEGEKAWEARRLCLAAADALEKC